MDEDAPVTDEPSWDAGLAPASRKRAPRAAPPTAEAAEERIGELEREVHALREDLARGQERIEELFARPATPFDDEVRAAITTLQSDVALMASRIATLLGGPTLTELMDRIDELAEQLPSPDAGRRRWKQ